VSAEPGNRTPAPNLSTRAYGALARMIHERRLKGGEAILEAKLAADLAISRTPLREALQRLEGEGLVTKSASRSYTVRRVDLAEYLHSLKVREVVEPEAAALAAGTLAPAAIAAVRAEIAALSPASYLETAHWQADAHLHDLFIDACGNPVMRDVLKGLRATTHLFEVARLQDRLAPDNAEHLAILDALEAGDARAARRAVQTHIRSLTRYALAAIR
jgi:DNA-binding GntR family transcriptional regulator